MIINKDDDFYDIAFRLIDSGYDYNDITGKFKNDLLFRYIEDECDTSSLNQIVSSQAVRLDGDSLLNVMMTMQSIIFSYETFEDVFYSDCLYADMIKNIIDVEVRERYLSLKRTEF